MIALLASLGVLLLAAAGMARHIWVHHRELQLKADADGSPGLDAAKKIDVETEL